MFEDNEAFNFNDNIIDNNSFSKHVQEIKVIKAVKKAVSPIEKLPTEHTDSALKKHSDTVLELLNQPNKKTKTVERKFPGPAGLISLSNESPLKKRKKDNETDEEPEEILCSQVTATTFEHGLWQQMRQDFESLPELYSISWIKEKSRAYSFPLQRIPFLTGIIESIDLSGNSGVTVLLRDKFDHMTASIHRNLLKEYENQFTVGSVIVLNSVSYLTSRKLRICQHIIILKSNIMAFYCQEDKHNIGFNKGSLSEFVQNYEKKFNEVNDENADTISDGVVTAGANLTSNKVEKTIIINKNNYLIYDRPEDSEILKSIFEDLDTNLLFNDDF